VKPKCVIGLAFFAHLIGIGAITAQAASIQNKVGGEVVLSVDLIKSKKKEVLYILRLRNNGPEGLFHSTHPRHGCGGSGPYVSLDRIDGSIVDIQWRVFDRDIVQSIACYKNNTGTELKRLDPGKDAEESVAIKWPLSETVPPYLSRVHERKIIRQNVKHLRFTVGYFVEEEGILEFLARKSFGWFIQGDESLETGVFRRKRLYEIQKLVSAEIALTEPTNQ
jgi:hypothetical protein